MTVYLNCLKSLDQTKWHVTLKIAITFFPTCCYIGWKVRLKSIFMEVFNGSEVTTTNQKPKTSSLILLLCANFCHCFWQFAKTWRKCAFGMREILQLKWIRGYNLTPEREHDEINSFFQRYFFRLTFFSKWTSNFKFFSPDSSMPPSRTLIHETNRCSQIWPTTISYEFIGVV